MLEKINYLFGDGWITDIKFIHAPANAPTKHKKKTKSLTVEEKNSLSQLLETIDDPELKERLSTLGEAFYQDQKN